MAVRRYLVDLKDRHLPPSVGNKAINLRKLRDRGFRIPDTFVCTWDAYHRYLEDDVSLVDALRGEISHRLDPKKKYAVRSSANIEDSLDRSFAGLFKSVLNGNGVDQIFQFIWSIWGVVKSPAVLAYLNRQGIPASQLSMAVILQEMVEPVAAGVALSRNPVTGADEVVVEAVLGMGDALVQTGVTPYRWVNKHNNWLIKPEVDSIPLSLIEQVVQQTHAIARRFKAHVDLEWAWDGRALYWLQMREITTLNRHNMYSNYMSKEMLPGMIKPLVWSVNVPLKSRVFVKFMNEMMGETGIKPEELVKQFYYRVYFNMGVIGQAFVNLGLPAESIEMMTGVTAMGKKVAMKPTLQILRRLPNIIGFVHDKWTFHRKAGLALPDLEQRVKTIPWREAGRMTEQELLDAIDRLDPLEEEVAYYNILCPILSVMHNRMLEGELKLLGVDLANFEVSEGLSELADYDPSNHLFRLNTLFNQLDPQAQERIRRTNYPEFVKIPGISGFQKAVSDFIERFGHLSDNGNDFSCKPWREDGDMVLRLILDFKPQPEENGKKVRFADLKVNFLRRPMVKLFYERVRQYRLLREQLSALYTRTYGLYRYFYLALGDILVKRGFLDETQDIYYLSDSEVRQLLNGCQPLPDCRSKVARHKADMEKYRCISLPTVIYGDEEPPIEDQSCEKLTGLATSIGCYTGPVKVVRGIGDFGKVQSGDVLVIPYSDVGWSPLFARVGAVIAESGGLLSHSSIIAREYGIPAVVSVNGAMNLSDQMRVTVDGHTGHIAIHAA